jgi:phosphoserine aminotransferase
MAGKLYFTAGPTRLHPAVEPAMRRALAEGVASISHRGAGFRRVFERATGRVRELLGIPATHSVFFLSSGTECMERIVQNCVREQSLHLVNGAFSERFHRIAESLGKRAARVEAEWGEGLDTGAVVVPDRAELLCVTQNETSTGVATDLGGLAAIRRQRPDLLVAVDMVSSAPCMEVDFELVDCAFFSVQKGFGMPAGLAVLSAGPRALERAAALKAEGQTIGSYHSFESLAAKAAKHETPETPNVLAIHVLGEVCRAILAEGVAAMRERTAQKAGLLYEALERHPALSPFVADRALRSPTVIVGRAHGGSRAIIGRLAEEGFVVSAGYGRYRDEHLRIANFPAHELSQVRDLVDAL